MKVLINTFFFLFVLGLYSEERLSDAPKLTGNPAYIKTSKRSIVKQVNTENRREVVSFYKSDYLKPQSVKNGWNGNTQSCNAGNNSQEYTDATLKTINYFRAMLGVPADITFKQEYNDKALKSALIMEANFNLSHNPPSNWKCYSEEGAKGAANSNIAIGASGSQAISLYMWDPGAGNYFVGHRRWIMSPSQAVMGTGSTEKGDSLWVFGGFRKEENAREYVSWPNSGFVPFKFGYSKDYRWSFTAHKAQVKDATVIVKKAGKNLKVNKEKYAGGYGEGDTIVWTLPELDSKELTRDESFDVEIQDIKKEGKSISHKYKVTFINPDIEPENSTTIEEDKIIEAMQLTPEELVDFAEASAHGDNSKLTAYLKKGVDPNIKYKGWTALMLAAYYGRLENVKTLLEYKADKNLDFLGYKPADFAKANSHQDIIALLGFHNSSRSFRGNLPSPPKN